MSMLHHYDAMPEQEQVLDEAYLDALEQKVFHLSHHIKHVVPQAVLLGVHS